MPFSYCVWCDDAILTPDGALRCNKTFGLAKEPCDDFSPGNFKIYKIQPMPIPKFRKKAGRKVR